ncbi:hypothetical protein MACJ_001875 [Theileria orientalis]|uniref:Uncharacterized protein n=1 Tax=Theileria orientalis TaxID=68886 RepID=A0A976QV44_THEOR|nr:hypothetical protein MACJ_001875 [Theileria orientalis]
MFRKRISLNKREVSSELPESPDSSSSSENLIPKDSINDNSFSNTQESTSFSVSDPNVSFRRGLRDGTITNKVNLSQNSSFKHTKKTISNLSFTDSLIENDLDKINLRSTDIKRSFQKKRSRKGLDLTNTKKLPICVSENVPKTRISPEPTHSGLKFEDEVMEDSEFSDKLSKVSDSDPESDDVDYGKDAAQTSQKDDGEVGLFEISDVEDDFDIELEISQIIKNVDDELHILNKNLGSTNNMLQQNTEKIAKLDTDQIELVNQINSYFNLLEASRTLFSLVESKLPELSRCLDKTRTNRIDETEYLLRMRRWIYCDLLRLSGVNELDYGCGELEDIDDMGKDLSITIYRTFNSRVESLQHFKQNLVKNGLKHSSKFNFKDLESYLDPEVRDLFTIKLGFNYTFEQLSELYEYEMNLERVDINLMDDVTDEYKSISRSLEVFRTLKSGSDLLESFDFTNNLKDVFLFYVKTSILIWNPLVNPNVESLEWFRVAMEFDSHLLPAIVDEVLYFLALNCIEYFDIESYDQCNNLSQFLKFVLKNSGGTNRSMIVEKITSSLHKSLQTKVSILTFGVNPQDSFESPSLTIDPVVGHVLKFGYLNLVANIVCFSDFLSNATLATFVVDDLFLNKMLPLLNFDSSLDAFLVLNFKMATAPLGKHFQIKTKNNSIVKLTFSRFSESLPTLVSNSDIFNSLSVPMDSNTYTRLMSS